MHTPSFPELRADRRRVPRPLRLLALALALCLAWSLGLAAPAQALTLVVRAAPPANAVNVLALLLSRARPLMPQTDQMQAIAEAPGMLWTAGSG